MKEDRKPHGHSKDSGIKKPELQISLLTNNTLALIINGLGQIFPEWDHLYDTLTDSQKIKIQGVKNGDLLGRLAEVHVARVLDALADDNPAIIRWPIANGQETRDFRFEQSGHNYVAYKRGGTTSCVEYDMLTEVENLPVVWEVKLGYSLDQATRAQRIKTIARPLFQHYGHANFGYVVVAPMCSNQPDSLENFITKGGIITRIPTTKAEFESSIKSANGNGYHS